MPAATRSSTKAEIMSTSLQPQCAGNGATESAQEHPATETQQPEELSLNLKIIGRLASYLIQVDQLELAKSALDWLWPLAQQIDEIKGSSFSEELGSLYEEFDEIYFEYSNKFDALDEALRVRNRSSIMDLSLWLTKRTNWVNPESRAHNGKSSRRNG